MMARNVSVIVHCAANVHWTASYETLRKVNVFPLYKLIELAHKRGVKPMRFFYVSTLSASTEFREVLPDLRALEVFHSFDFNAISLFDHGTIL